MKCILYGRLAWAPVRQADPPAHARLHRPPLSPLLSLRLLSPPAQPSRSALASTTESREGQRERVVECGIGTAPQSDNEEKDRDTDRLSKIQKWELKQIKNQDNKQWFNECPIPLYTQCDNVKITKCWLIDPSSDPSSDPITAE